MEQQRGKTHKSSVLQSPPYRCSPSVGSRLSSASRDASVMPHLPFRRVSDRLQADHNPSKLSRDRLPTLHTLDRGPVHPIVFSPSLSKTGPSPYAPGPYLLF